MNIKEARERAGLTIAEAAEKIGTTGGVVKDWEKGKAPLPNTFKKLCVAYDVSPKEVIVEGRNDQLPLTLPGARYNAGLSVEKAATEMGLSYGIVQSMERGLAIISEERKAKFCELYGITADEIVWPRDKAPEKQSIYASDPALSAQPEWNAGAPEHLPEDQHIIELEKAHDEIKALKERLSFYEESEEGEIIGLRSLTEQYKQQIADLTEEAAGNKEEAQAYVQTILELKVELNEQKNKVSSLRLENTRLERQVIELKAEAYDLMKEKAHLFEEMFKHYHEKEDTE